MGAGETLTARNRQYLVDRMGTTNETDILERRRPEMAYWTGTQQQLHIIPGLSGSHPKSASGYAPALLPACASSSNHLARGICSKNK